MQVDLGLAPLDDGRGGRDRHAARDFFLVVVGDGVAFIDASEALRGPGGKKHGGCERGFARVRMPNQGDVSDVSAFVSLHR